MGVTMKRLYLALLIFTILLGCKSTPKQEEEDAASRLNRGNEFYQLYNFDGAINEYTEALNMDPELVEVYISRGNTYSGKLEFNAARNDYNTGAEKNEEWGPYARGYALYLDKDYNAAIREFTQAIEQNVNLLAAYNDRGLCYQNLRNHDQAIADFNAAIGINSNSAFPYNNRGNSYLEKRDFDKAIEDFSRAIELYPAFAFPYNGRGLAYQAKGEQALAEADFAIAEELK